jgi:hypothetical protein
LSGIGSSKSSGTLKASLRMPSFRMGFSEDTNQEGHGNAAIRDGDFLPCGDATQ